MKMGDGKYLAVHQLFYNSKLCSKNWLINWYTGGLNHQIEHHIFPNISHIHYGKIGEIVKQTTKECNLPYYEFKDHSCCNCFTL